MGAEPWVVMPVVAHPTYTDQAIADVLAQTVPCRLLVVNQGVDDGFRQRLEAHAEDSDRVFVWTHLPALPSLAATWNRALEFAWSCGAQEALVINNDIRLAPNALERLLAEMEAQGTLIVTGVGVGPQQFQPGQLLLEDITGSHGGPDFSCFLIDKCCHESYRFDENFVPAYCEDIDLHRRLLLDGRGQQVYAINVPFLHYGSTTLKFVDPKRRARIEEQTALYARAHYKRKWGGTENQETFRVPFGPEAEVGITTPELQEEVRRGEEHRRVDVVQAE